VFEEREWRAMRPWRSYSAQHSLSFPLRRWSGYL
jgi:hypothetical protein